MTLPLVDLSNDSQAGMAIDAALANYGFLQLANIGIEPADLEAVFAASEAFFQSDDRANRQFLYRSAVENFGYQGLLEENLDPGAQADLKETFTMRNILRAPLPLERWPSAEFREVMMQFYAKALTSAHRIQRTMACALGMPQDFFVTAHSGDNNTLRLLYYPDSAEAAPLPDAAPARRGRPYRLWLHHPAVSARCRWVAGPGQQRRMARRAAARRRRGRQ